MAQMIGYARVSTQAQSLDQQHDAPGRVTPWSWWPLDRLGRSLSGIIRTVETLAGRGIVMRSHRESIDTSGAVGRMLLGIFGSLAEYERSLTASAPPWPAPCTPARWRWRVGCARQGSQFPRSAQPSRSDARR
jgi:hypothetical protein